MPVPIAVVSHRSACEALRHIKGSEMRWPPEPRDLLGPEGCITNQRQFKELSRRVSLTSHGIVSSPVDLLAPSKAARSRGKGARFHVWSRPLPARSTYRVDDNLFVSSPELVVVQLATSEVKLDAVLDDFADGVNAEIDALASLGIDEKPVLDPPTVWENTRRLVATAAVACEFAGSYRLGGNDGKVAYHARPLLRTADVERMVSAAGAGFAARRVMAVARLAFDNSASPMETALALMLTMPLEFGGIGLPKPQLNVPIDVSGTRGLLSDRDRVTPDMLWGGQRVALEYDSHERHGGAGTRRLGEDAMRSNILTALGYRVFRVTTDTVRTLRGVELLAHQIAQCLDVELEEPTAVQAQRRQRAYAELMPGAMTSRTEVG